MNDMSPIPHRPQPGPCVARVEPAEPAQALPAKFPAVAGGWCHRRLVLPDRSIVFTAPANPDALLDDPAVLAANERDDYMPYWGFLWPAAPPMAAAVVRTSWPAGLDALELGCGIGLVGIAALRAGLRATLTDYDATSVDLAVWNARCNGFDGGRVDGRTLDWRRPEGRRYPVILGSDVTYERRNHGPLLDVIEHSLEPGGVAWIGDAGRQISAGFVDLARRRGYDVNLFDADGAPLNELAVGRFQLFVLSRARSRDSDGRQR